LENQELMNMNRHTGRALLIGLMLISLLSLPVHGNAEESGLAGDWGGMKDQLAASGLSLDAVYTGEFVRNLSPGLVNGRKQTVYQNTVDLAATLDSGDAGLWQGGVFYVSGLFFNGGLPTANVIGDLQTVSNIEATGYQFSIFEAWYEQQVGNSGLSILVGLHDLNSEFYVTEYGSLFINSSFGLGADMGGNVPVSTFPKASWAVRAKYAMDDAWYVQAGVYDGDPATKKMNATEGYLSAFEAGMATGEGIVKLGAWHHTADRTVAGRSFGSDYGLYGLTDQPLMEFAGMQLGGFAQFGWVPKQRNDIVRYLGAGLHLSGLPLRADDELGFGVANAVTRSGTEHAIELTWRAPLYAGVAVQPSMQWVMNPGGDAAAGTIPVAMLRFEVAL